MIQNINNHGGGEAISENCVDLDAVSTSKNGQRFRRRQWIFTLEVKVTLQSVGDDGRRRPLLYFFLEEFNGLTSQY